MRRIVVSPPVGGVLTVTINTKAFGLTGEHWKDQLTGRNRKKWGKIYIHWTKSISSENRREALWETRGLYKGHPVDMDECPGAMFIYETRGEVDADVMAVDRNSNRSFGSALRHAFGVIEDRSGWYEVNFKFIG